MINNVNITQANYEASLTINSKNTKKGQSTEIQLEEKYTEISASAAVYEHEAEEQEVLTSNGYKVDMDKLIAMKEETDARMVQMFRDTVRGTGLKQLGGVRGILDKLRAGEEVTLEIEYTAEDVEQAKADVAEDGYWGAEKTSDRLVDFAKALSGGDPEKIEMLKDAFKKGFAEIEEMFGGELPELSYNTYDLTMDKFDAWANGDEEQTEVV